MNWQLYRERVAAGVTVGFILWAAYGISRIVAWGLK